MFPGSISLALCTVVLRRCFDTLTGRIPVAAPVSNLPHISSMFMISGALIYLYSHLRRGTLVRIGQGHRNSHAGSKNIIIRGSKHKSWFLKNLWGKRKCCTEAIFKIAKHFSDSVTNLNPCLLLPKETFQVSFPNVREQESQSTFSHDIYERNSEDSCEIIFSNSPYQKINQQKQILKDANKSLINACGDNLNVDKKRRTRLSVKRLEKSLAVEDNAKQSKSSNKFRSENKKRTRSGRIYNPFS